ncbi:MAG: helix-turn-helix transcriptional regulator [Candidatus Solibacter sp.]|jgi:transcriptional regulator with XRE-family HTH domain
MFSDGRKTLIKRLRRGKEARKQFVDSHLRKGVAFQIRATRDRLGWSQEDLAKEAGMTQNAISRLESPEYGKPTITTLKRLASALDVGLVVHFVPFSHMIDWASSTRRIDPGLTPESLAVPSFEAEEVAGVFDYSPPQVWAMHRADIGTKASEISFQRVVGQQAVIAGRTEGAILRKPATSETITVRPVQSATGEVYANV